MGREEGWLGQVITMAKYHVASKPSHYASSLDDARACAIYEILSQQAGKGVTIPIERKATNSNSYNAIGAVHSYFNPFTGQIAYMYLQYGSKGQFKEYPLNRNGTIDTKMSPAMRKELSKLW